MQPDTKNQVGAIQPSKLLKRARRVRIAGWVGIGLASGFFVLWPLTHYFWILVYYNFCFFGNAVDAHLNFFANVLNDAPRAFLLEPEFYYTVIPAQPATDLGLTDVIPRGHIICMEYFYKKHFRLIVPFWMIIVALVYCSRALFKAASCMRRRATNCCTACGYSRELLSSPYCPECGKVLAGEVVVTPLRSQHRLLCNTYLLVAGAGLLLFPIEVGKYALWEWDSLTDSLVNTTGAWALLIDWFAFHVPSFLGQRIFGVLLATGVWLAWLHSLKHNRYLRWPVWVHVVVAIVWYLLSAPLLQIAIWFVA